jgi:hypothetical protein
VPDQTVVILEVHPVAVDQVELLAVTDRPAAAGAQIARNAVAAFHMPTVLQLTAGEALSLYAGIGGGTLLEECAPVNLCVRPLISMSANRWDFSMLRVNRVKHAKRTRLNGVHSRGPLIGW